jgi:hypothetical protein
MSTRIVISDWIILRVRIPIKRARLPRLGNERVGLGEVANRRVIPAGNVIVQPQLGLGELTGIAVFGESGILGYANLAEGRVLDGAAPSPVLIGGGAGAAQMVREHPVQHFRRGDGREALRRNRRLGWGGEMPFMDKNQGKLCSGAVKGDSITYNKWN